MSLGLGTLIHQVERFGVAFENRACQLFDLLVGGVWRYRWHLRVAVNVQNGGSVGGERAIPCWAYVVVAVYGNADVEHAKSESQYESTIAHGYLTLSLIPAMSKDNYQITGRMTINYYCSSSS